MSTSIHGRVVAAPVAILSAYALIVASWSLSLQSASIGLLGALALAWLAARAVVGNPPTIVGVDGKTAADVVDGPRFTLVSMPINHYGEKLRWCLDLLDVDYEERDLTGILSIYLRGRTVPWLVDRHAFSRIGNSDEAVFYLGAVVGPLLPEDAQPAVQALVRRTPETLAWERRVSDLGHAIQGWAYFYLLAPGADSDLCLRYWGAKDPQVPLAYRWTLRLLLPVLREGMRAAFRHPDPVRQRKRRQVIDTLVEDVEAQLAKSGGPYLFGEHLSYVDLGVCALLAPLVGGAVMPKWARGRFSSFAPLVDHPNMPAELREFESQLAHRPCGAYVIRTYTEWRDTPLVTQAG